DHLETPKLPLRVKRKVKSRHKPISDPNTGSATSQIAATPERWSGNTAYALIFVSFTFAIIPLTRAFASASESPVRAATSCAK
ncbi:hypothetical protein, partial [Mesorhizobium sp. dw_380]|uniref:hypothetical protein n=1 Tax=Mesorhizobium sp. dw_380 TaxID=2812001 RepID=UPI001BDE47EE